MKKKTLFQKNFIIGILVTVLAMVSLNLSNQHIFASEANVFPSYDVHLNEDRTVATIAFDMSQIDTTKYEIQSIVSQESQKVLYEKGHDAFKFTYEVTKNGDYIFVVNYKDIIESSLSDEDTQNQTQGTTNENNKNQTISTINHEVEKKELVVHIDQIVTLTKEENQVMDEKEIPPVKESKPSHQVSDNSALRNIYVNPNCPIVSAYFIKYESDVVNADGSTTFNGTRPLYGGETIETKFIFQSTDAVNDSRTFFKLDIHLGDRKLLAQPAMSISTANEKYADNLDINNGDYVYLPKIVNGDRSQAYVIFRITIPEDWDSDEIATLQLSSTLGRTSDSVIVNNHISSDYTVLSRPKFKNSPPISNVSIPLKEGGTLTQNDALQYLYGYNGPSEISNTMLHECGGTSYANLGTVISKDPFNAVNRVEGTFTPFTGTPNLTLLQKTFNNTKNDPIAPINIPLGSMGMYYTKLIAYDTRTMENNKPYVVNQERRIVRRLWIGDHYVNTNGGGTTYHGLSQDFKIKNLKLSNMNDTELKNEILTHIQGYQEKAVIDSLQNVSGDNQAEKLTLNVSQITSIVGMTTQSPAKATPYDVTVNVKINGTTLQIPIKITVEFSPSGKVERTEYYRIHNDGSETLIGNSGIACSGEVIKVRHYVTRNTGLNIMSEDYMLVNSITLDTDPITQLSIMDKSAKSIINGTEYPITGDLKTGTHVKFAPNNSESYIEYKVQLPSYLDSKVNLGNVFKIEGVIGESEASDRNLFDSSAVKILSRPAFTLSSKILNNFVALSQGKLSQEQASKILYSQGVSQLIINAYKQVSINILNEANHNVNNAYNATNGIFFKSTDGNIIISQKTFNNERNIPIAPTQIPLDQLGMYYTKLSAYDNHFGDYNTHFNQEGDRTIVRRMWIGDHYASSKSENYHGISKDFQISDIALHKMSQDELKAEVLKYIQVYLEKTTIDAHGNILGDIQAEKITLNTNQITIRGITNNVASKDTPYSCNIDFSNNGETLSLPINITVYREAPDCYVVIPKTVRLENTEGINSSYIGKKTNVKLIETEKNTTLNILVQTDDQLTLSSPDTSDTYTVQFYDEGGSPKPISNNKTEIGVLNKTTNIINFYLSAKKKITQKSVYHGTMNYYISFKNS